jgi:hypothetical protein
MTTLKFMELVLLQIPNMGDCSVGRYLVREVLNHLYCPNTIIHIHLFFAVDVITSLVSIEYGVYRCES